MLEEKKCPNDFLKIVNALSCNCNNIILHKSENFYDGFIVEFFVHFRK